MNELNGPPIPSQKEYLFSSGILEKGTKEEIALAKQEYRKEYLKYKKQEHRLNNKTITISFPLKYSTYLERKAKQHNMRLAEFIKACIGAYLEQVFILPDNKNVKALETELNRIGNNINQMVRHCHRLSLDPEEALTEIQGLLAKIDKQISSQLRYPMSLEHMVRTRLQNQPVFIHKLQGIIKEHLHASKDDSSSREFNKKTS